MVAEYMNKAREPLDAHGGRWRQNVLEGLGGRMMALQPGDRRPR